MWRNLLLVTVLTCAVINSQFYNCHDDPGFSPDEGPLEYLQFTWLGVLQYIHVKNGTPHYFRVPRVILITRQFVLSTAKDAAQIPDGYALGNVVFGDYERDEGECRVTLDDIALGTECEPAILLMPIADVLLHPEYKNFGVKYSIALLKMIALIRSKYMLPACLPFKDFIVDKKTGKLTTEKLFHIDFTSDVPRDFIEEEKEVQYVSILPRELCQLYEEAENSTKIWWNRMACTTGCGFHAGAPTLVHEHTGHWSIVALSQGGHSCPDPLRPRRLPPPPRHIMIHPYVPWITAAISGKALGRIDKDDPFGFRSSATVGHAPDAWVGHWWMGGIRCYDRGDAAANMFKFYHEEFRMKSNLMTMPTYMLEIDAAYNTRIVCVKVGMPYQLSQPRIWNLNSPAVKLHIPLMKVNDLYKFQVEAWGYNSSLMGSSADDMYGGTRSLVSSSSEDLSDFESAPPTTKSPPTTVTKRKKTMADIVGPNSPAGIDGLDK